ncbi:hypothetical protein NQZ79_g8887 [Umbelopsis isabellina]|nr:hypothetical protein NQZ79_g8887 [Umbelopsis isabellina]
MLSIATWIPLAAVLAASVAAQNSPFYWQDEQLDYSRESYQETGKMEQIGRTGVAAMHAVLLSERKILVIDKAEWNEAKFESGQSAYSTEYDIITNQYRLLHLDTNTFCSGGGFLKNGTFIGTGGGESKSKWGAKQGWASIRFFQPCKDSLCHWQEFKLTKMTGNRWYPSVEQLPEGNLLIMGGSTTGAQYNRDEINMANIEYFPPRPEGAIAFPFLNETMPYNLYPFIHTLPDGNLWVFANRKSIIYDYKNNRVVKRLPDIPGNSRSYPLTGASVMLPLDPKNNYNVEIIVCGGSETIKGKLSPKADADNTCGRINLSDEDPQWEMDTFVHPRLMPDGVILADGKVLFLNGCKKGFAGYNKRNFDPTFDPIIYDPSKPKGQRWTSGLASTDIARMYHSVALSLPDGRVWIAGSNNIDPPNATAVYPEYPTEFRVEYFSPPYLFQSPTRPIVSKVPKVLVYDEEYHLNLNLNNPHTIHQTEQNKIQVGLLRPGFSTHSMHMSQRYVILEHSLSEDSQRLTIKSPPNANIFPPGPAILHVLRDGVPAEGTYLHIAASEYDLVV